MDEAPSTPIMRALSLQETDNAEQKGIHEHCVCRRAERVGLRTNFLCLIPRAITSQKGAPTKGKGPRRM